MDDLILENLHLTKLFKLVEQHKLHINIIEENRILSAEGKKEISNAIEDIFLVIKNQSGTIRVYSLNLLASDDDDNLNVTSSKKGRKRGGSK